MGLSRLCPRGGLLVLVDCVRDANWELRVAIELFGFSEKKMMMMKKKKGKLTLFPLIPFHVAR